MAGGRSEALFDSRVCICALLNVWVIHENISRSELPTHHQKNGFGQVRPLLSWLANGIKQEEKEGVGWR
jgi:hypothetical protein